MTGRTPATEAGRLAALLHETRRHSGPMDELCETTARGFMEASDARVAAAWREGWDAALAAVRVRVVAGYVHRVLDRLASEAPR